MTKSIFAQKMSVQNFRLTCNFHEGPPGDLRQWLPLLWYFVISITFTPVSISAEVFIHCLSGDVNTGVPVVQTGFRINTLLHHLMLGLHPLTHAFEHDLIGRTRPTGDGDGLLLDDVVDWVWVLEEDWNTLRSDGVCSQGRTLLSITYNGRQGQ